MLIPGKLIKAVEQLGKQHGTADYILMEVHSYLISNTPTHPEGIKFFDWFNRQYSKYRKGDV